MTDVRPLRVVLVHRYFAPDTPPYAHILHKIGSELATRGHRITVLTCMPSYRPDAKHRAPAYECLDGYEIHRWRVLNDRTSSVMKLLNLVWFCGRLSLARRRFRDADVVMAATTPPVLLAAVCSVLARSVGARFVYHKQDIYPEVISRGRINLPLRLLRGIDAATDRRADRVVVLSEDMAESTRHRGVDPTRVEVINNFDPWELSESPMREGPSEVLTVVFAGNLGRFQGLDAVFDLMRSLRDEPRIVFHFFGDGVRLSELRELAASSPQIVAHGFVPARSVADFVRTRADLGIVSLEPGVIAAAYPSKTMTYLRHGCPLLALVEHSELSMMVEDEGIGITAPTPHSDGLEMRLRQLAADPSWLVHARKRAQRVYATRFASEGQLARWTELFEMVATE